MLVLHKRAPIASMPPAQIRGPEVERNLLCRLFTVGDTVEEAALPFFDLIEVAAGPCGDHRQSHAHRIEDDEGIQFIPARKRKDIHGAQVSDEIRLKTGEKDSISQLFGSDIGFEIAQVRFAMPFE